MPGAAAAVLLGDHQAEQPGVAEHLEDVLRVGGVGVDRAGPGARSCPGRACARVAWSSSVFGGQIERHRGGSLLMRLLAIGSIAPRDATFTEVQP